MKVLKCCAAAILWLGLCVEVFAQHADVYRHTPLYGVDAIQPSAIQITREQMRDLFVVSDSYAEGSGMGGMGVDRSKLHNKSMRRSACSASVMPCSDPDDLRTVPFTFLARYPLFRHERDVTEWIVREAMKRESKIVTESKTNADPESGIEGVYGSSLPFVLIDSAGNKGVDNFFNPFTYDRHGNRFTRNGRTVTGSAATALRNYLDIVEAQKVIYASSYETFQGVPRRYEHATGCLGVEESCVSLPVDGHAAGGTSSQSPKLGAAMASILGVFPRYDVFDLAALVNSCAQSFPSIIGGVVDMPCVIETICAETNSTSSVCDIVFPGPVFNDRRVGVLENPGMTADMLHAERSGLSVISGWVCDAEEIIIELNGVKTEASYGTDRGDTLKACGDTDNGFGLLYNWNLLGDGIHSVKAYADGVLFASTRVRVTTLGKEFLRGAELKERFYFIPFIDGTGDNTRATMFVQLEWWEPIQNFVIVGFYDYAWDASS